MENKLKKAKFKTALEFTKNIFTTGAVAETSREVEIEITNNVPTTENQIVVEYGMGHGNITREILNKLAPNSRLFAFEVNKEFCDFVKQEIQDDRLTIVNDGAENISKYVPSSVHAIVSSIPFTFFSKEKTALILGKSYEVLLKDHYLSQILYSKIHTKKFEGNFDKCEIVKTNNFPAGYVYHCQKLS